MPLRKDVALRSNTVKTLVKRVFLPFRKRKVSPKQERSARKQIAEALVYLDRTAINRGDSTMQILELLGPPYGRMPDNDWLYPGGERNQFYVLSFVADSVSTTRFTTIYDLESGR